MRDDGRGAKFKIAKRLQFEEQDWKRSERARAREREIKRKAIIEVKERETDTKKDG